MADILHKFPIKASREDIFRAITRPEGLDAWWTLSSQGEAVLGSEYRFFFGPEYDWRAVITHVEANQSVCWKFLDAEPDWTGTWLQIKLEDGDDGWVWLDFVHAGWDRASDHFRRSSFCWAQYLILLKIYLERGETTPYERRNDV